MLKALRNIQSAKYTVLDSSKEFVGTADGFIALTDCNVLSINGNLTQDSLYTQISEGEKRLLPITQLQVSSGYILLLNPKGIYNPTLLLDQYSGAAAAYSLRKLSSTYSGSAIRVRRSSDNAEQDIGFSGNDLDTSALTTFTGASDGFVVTWYDQSGNGNDATQATAARQPQIVSGGSTILENGKAAVDSLGQTQLEMNADVTMTSLFSVAKVDVQRSVNYLLWNNTVDQGVFQNGSNTSVKGLGSFDSTNIVTRTDEDLLQNLGYFNHSGGEYSVGKNGLSVATGTSNVLNVNSIFRIFNNDFIFSGKVQEIVIYPIDQSSNRSDIETNINNYYSIY